MARFLSRTDRHRLAIGLALYAVLVSPPVLRLLESRMVLHVLVLLPALVGVGWLCGSAFRARMASFNAAWNAGGIPGLLTAVLAGMFWMLPRLLDQSLAHVPTELAKLISLPLLVGAALALSWAALAPLWRGVIKSNLVSMLAVFGWLYTVAPVRFCTSYLQSDQEQLGQVFLGLAAALAVLWSLPWFFTGRHRAADRISLTLDRQRAFQPPPALTGCPLRGA